MPFATAQKRRYYWKSIYLGDLGEATIEAAGARPIANS